MLWEVLTASSLLPPTAEEVLMEEDFKEMGGGGERVVRMSKFLTFLRLIKVSVLYTLQLQYLSVLNCGVKGQLYCSIAQNDRYHLQRPVRLSINTKDSVITVPGLEFSF